MKILHIEDSPEIGAIFADVLKMEGHEFESITDGRNGLDMVLKNNYDVILLDMCMPDYSGMDFLLDLKTKNSSEVRKVIIITNLELDEFQTKFLTDLGVCSIHQKPVSVQYLLSKLLPLEGKNQRKYKSDSI
jgi:DNA-binding response OmpR family regulator